ncbi:metal ABC transporter substrate-binding protein [Nocardioidaceae bacterium]|nr:metal ABC transporter substrate-binding protein [Nocardioidaceae bacterium]
MRTSRAPRLSLFATAVTAGCLTLTGCGALGLSDDEGTTGVSSASAGEIAPVEGSPQVVAAFYPLAWVSEQIAGDRADVVNLTTPGGEPHDLELGVQQTSEVSAADLVVYEAGFQPAVDAAIAQQLDGVALDVAEVVELEPFEEHGEEHGEEHADEHAGEDHADEHADEHAGEHAGEDHDHGDLGDLDPHFWQDPARMAELASAVGERMAALDPDGAEAYEANTDRVVASLEELDQAYTDGLARCERDVVVTNHDAFGYLTRYGLEFEPVTGISPDAEPTAGDLARLQDLIAEEGITTVFYERLVSPQTARVLAADTGVETAVLDPLEGLTDETADEDYLSLMRENLAALERANGC